jgi:hypothetical protein
MKVAEHSVFAESRKYGLASIFWSNFAVQRQRNRQKIRERVEEFINEIGVENVVSVSEHASTLGPFSVVVWWYREVPEGETLVIRASDESETA